MSALAGVREARFGVMVSIIKAQHGTLTLSEVEAQLIEAEIETHEEFGEGGSACVIKGRNHQQPECWICGSLEHFKRDCPKFKERQKQQAKKRDESYGTAAIAF